MKQIRVSGILLDPGFKRYFKNLESQGIVVPIKLAASSYSHWLLQKDMDPINELRKTSELYAIWREKRKQYSAFPGDSPQAHKSFLEEFKLECKKKIKVEDEKEDWWEGLALTLIEFFTEDQKSKS